MGNDTKQPSNLGEFLEQLEFLLGDGIKEVSIIGDVDEGTLSQLRELDGREVPVTINATGKKVPMIGALKELGTAESADETEQGRFGVMVTLKP